MLEDVPFGGGPAGPPAEGTPFERFRFRGAPRRSYPIYNPDRTVLTQTHGARGAFGAHHGLGREFGWDPVQVLFSSIT